MVLQGIRHDSWPKYQRKRAGQEKRTDHATPQRAHGAIKTSLRRQNDVVLMS